MIMFFGELLTSIFWALVIAIILWILCAFAGRLVNPDYRISLFLHLLCFVISVLTVILLSVVFTCNKINRKVSEVDAGIAKLVMTDGTLINRLIQEIDKARSKKDNGELTTYIAEIFNEKISTDYPIVEKYVDIKQILEKTDFGKQISKISLSDITSGKAQEIIQVAAGELTKSVRSRIKSFQRKALITFILLQTVIFGVVLYRAGRYRKATHSAHYRRGNANRNYHYKNHKK